MIGVDAAVSQERPIAPHPLARPPIAFDDEDGLRIVRCDGQHAAHRIRDEGAAPESDAGSRSALELLVADAIHADHEETVGDRVRTLDGMPRVALGGVDGRILFELPADRRRIEEDVRTEQRRRACGLGEPLIPADEHAESSRRRFMHLEAEIPGREVELLVVERIVRDVHLAIAPGELAGFVEDDGGVVVEAGRAALEERDDERDPEICGLLRERLGRRARNRLRPVEAPRVFALAEIVGPEELGQADDFGALPRRVRDPVHREREIARGIDVAAHLYETDLEGGACLRRGPSDRIRAIRSRSASRLGHGGSG